MKRLVSVRSLSRIAIVFIVSVFGLSNDIASHAASSRDNRDAAEWSQQQKKLRQILDRRSDYIDAIVRRWAGTAGQLGRNQGDGLRSALMRLQPESLLAAGEAASYDDMMAVLSAGPVLPEFLGDISGDLVYTPIMPCRIVDTRKAGGKLSAGETRGYDVDGNTFKPQGGFDGSCGIPLGVARAVAMTLTAVKTGGQGSFRAWNIAHLRPATRVLSFEANSLASNTTVVSVTPNVGADFNLRVDGATSHALVEVVGFFAAPVATPLDCITVSSSVASVPVNVWTPVDANCPAGRTATGGGYDTLEGTLGYPGVWLTSLPNGNGWRIWVDNQTGGNRSVLAFVRCCRVPGR